MKINDLILAMIDFYQGHPKQIQHLINLLATVLQPSEVPRSDTTPYLIMTVSPLVLLRMLSTVELHSVLVPKRLEIRIPALEEMGSP